MILIKDFDKLDLRIGKIIAVEDVPGAEKLYLLKVDIGKQIQTVAGLKPYYKKEELNGKKIIVLANLEPVKIRGIESQGMLLAAVDNNKISILTCDKDMPVGAQVR